MEEASLELRQRGTELNVKKINAQQDSETASRFRVITVPTIIVVGSDGNIASWNPGLMRSDKIVRLFSTFRKVVY